ncbi:hypothetical protein AUJ67_02100 [Candidatus Desantisbacteria bacterium CG1_02_49_89]|nr:MAG: hypothetical protein AUJ67_02100 [Candidatus Desantisbacteria bacterium CG1_02_49_89]
MLYEKVKRSLTIIVISDIIRFDMRNERGFTLIEVVISAVIFLIAIAGVLYLFPRGMRSIARTKEQTQAVNLGQEKIEEIRGVAYSSITAGIPSSAPPYKNSALSDTAAGWDLAVSRTVTVQAVDDARDGTGGADSDGDMDDYKKISVTLKWASKGETHEIQLSTILTKR